MADRRAFVLAAGLALILGGGATAVAAIDGSSTPDVVESAALTAEMIGPTPEISPPVTGELGGDATVDLHAANTPDTTSVDRGTSVDTRGPSPEDEAGLRSDSTSPVPPEWNEPDDPGTGTVDGPGIGFSFEGMNFGTLVTLARSVGITMDEPVTAADGSITVSITLPDASVHQVWADFDTDGRISDATVDGTPISEFVRRFLAGEIG